MPSTTFKRGDLCGGYQVLELMGFGGIAEVYKALNLSSQEIVALKVLRRCHAQNGYVREHMLAEAELLSKMSHVNVVRVEDVGMDSEVLWMAMEYLPGVTLRTLMKTAGPLAIPTALYYVREIADGMSAAHEMGVIHRDLKPENVIITEQHKVKVLDMGAAKFYGWNVKETMKGSIFGTPLYMSPEHIREELIDARADVYSLGLMLYEMIAGFHPFAQGSNGPLGKYEVCEKQLNASPQPLSTVREGVPEELSELVQRATSKDRNERPATMMEFAQSVRAILKAIVAEGAVPSLHDVPLASGASERGAGEREAALEGEGKDPAPMWAGEEAGGAGSEDEDDSAITRVFTRTDEAAPASSDAAPRKPRPRGDTAPLTPPLFGAYGTEIMQAPPQSSGASSGAAARPRRERPAPRSEADRGFRPGVYAFSGHPGSFSVPTLSPFLPSWMRSLLRLDAPPAEVLRRDWYVENSLKALLGALMISLGIVLSYSWARQVGQAEPIQPGIEEGTMILGQLVRGE